MLRNYILIGFRNVLKNKLISTFNIVGLSVAFACVIVIFIFIEYNFSVDGFHTERDKVFLITHKLQNTGRDYGTTPSLLSTYLQSEASVKDEIVRVKVYDLAITSKGMEPFREFVTFADAGYFDLFTFPLKWGQSTSLRDPSKVIISSKMAEKYFGRDNPVGEDFTLYFPDGREVSLSVAGVADEFPPKRSFDFDFLVNFAVLNTDNSSGSSWHSFLDATFIKNSAGLGGLAQYKHALEKFRLNYNLKNPDHQIAGFDFEPLSTLAAESYRIRNVIARSFGPPSGKIAFSLIGLLLMVLACLNYINTATALGVARLKEIGIRKVVGGSRRSVIAQFMVENVIINCLSLLIGILLASFLLIPGFASLFQINLSFEFTNGYLWLFLLSILIITSVLSGAYPSLFISRYKPVTILSGVSKIGTKSVFSKVLLSFQFMFSFIYIVASILFIANESYQKKRDWGYNYKGLFVLQPADQHAFTYIKNELEKRPEVQAISTAAHHIGRAYKEIFVSVDTTMSLKAHQFMVDSVYLETLGLQLVQGASFAGRQHADATQVVINETFARAMQVQNPLGKSIRFDSTTYYVIGVVKDFRYTDFQRKIEPVVFTLATVPTNSAFIVVRAGDGSGSSMNESLKTIWKAVSPNVPYDGFQQEEVIDRYFILMSGHSKVMIFSALVAVIIACLGLFGLVYLNITARIKDYSIMKILGINTYLLIRQVSKIFVWFLFAAICVGFPSSLFLSTMLFKIVYADYIPVTIWYPMLGALLLIILAAFTVSFLILKLLKQNPINTLRN